MDRGAFIVTTAEWGRNGLFYENRQVLAIWSRGIRALQLSGGQHSWPEDLAMPSALGLKPFSLLVSLLSSPLLI